MAYTHYTKEELISIIQLKDEQINELQTDFDTVAESVLNLTNNIGVLDSIKNGEEVSIMKILPKITIGGGKIFAPLEGLIPVLKKYAVRYQDILG
jgi:prefoldin subunit 5